MTNYYAYHNWLVKLDVPMFGTMKAFIFDLNSGIRDRFSINASDTHKFVCDYIDRCHAGNTAYYIGFNTLFPITGQDKSKAQELFNRYF